MPKAKVILGSRRKQAQRAAKRQPTEILLSPPDFGTPERWQHATRTYHSDEQHNVAARVLEECALDALRVTGIISGAHYVAGLQLRRDYTRAHIAPKQTSRYTKSTGEKLLYREFTRNAGEEAAYQDWRGALLQAGAHQARVLVNVCCIGTPPTRAELESLRDGLQLLYKYYQALRLIGAPA